MALRALGMTVLLALSAMLLCTGWANEVGDLVLDHVHVSPAATDRGGSVTVTFGISYDGEYESVLVQLTCRRSDLESDCLLERKTVLLDTTPVLGTFTLDTQGLAPGEYEIAVRLDPDNALAERSKANNRRTSTLTVHAPLPDLVPVLLGVHPRSPIEASSTVSFSTRIANTGAAPAAAFRVLCEILPPGGTWTAVGSTEIPGLERDRHVDVSFPHRVDQEGAYGLRIRVQLREAADPVRGVRERDETNNTLETSFSVTPNVRRLPDLRPVSLTLSPASPLGWLENATATVVIVNTGGASTEEGVQVAFQYRRVGAGDSAWQDLKDPTVLKDTTSLDCDPANWAWAVRPAADQAEPLSIETGRNTRTLSVLVEFAAHQRERTCAGQVFPPRILPGEYELKVIVDPLGKIAEQDEKNNELIIGFSILGSELQAESLELSRSSVERGTDVVVNATVRNRGDKVAEAFTVGFYVGARRLDTYVYSGTGLAKNDTITVQGVLRTHDLTEGEHLVRVIIDPDRQLYEGDRSNNTISAPLDVRGLPRRRAELFIDRVEFSPATPIPPGQGFAVRAAVNNAGDLAAEKFDVLLRVYQENEGQMPRAGAVAELTTPVHRLEPMQTLWAEWPVMGLEEGVYRVVVEVDPATDLSPRGQVIEWDETNNTMITGFAVHDVVGVPVTVRRANLVCRQLIASPDVLTTGAPITIHAEIGNTGTEPAGTFRVELRWVYPTGQTQRVEAVRMGPLAPGESTRWTRTIDTSAFPHGVHHAILHVDVDGEVEESSEADNVCSTSIRIGAAPVDTRIDLVPISVRFDAPGAVLGPDRSVEQQQPLYVYVTIRNDGNVASGPFQVAFITDLGEGRETWTGVGALDQVEVSHRLPTGVPGEYTLTIVVDPDGLLPEENRANNTLTTSYTVVAPVITLHDVVPATGVPARWLVGNETGTGVYAVWVDGSIRGVSASAVSSIAMIPGTVTAVAWAVGPSPVAFLGMSDGTVHRVRLDSGVVSDPVMLGSSVVALAPGPGNRVFAAVDGGLQQLVPEGAGYRVSERIPISGTVLDVLYDRERNMVYALSTAGLSVYGSDLSRICFLDAADVVGTPTTMVLAGTGVYLGTNAGTGAVVYALSHCMPVSPEAGHILSAWRYPRVGLLPGSVTGIVVDPREIDPVYVATSTGVLHSLSLDGALQWSFSTEAAIRSTPVVDRRTGRIFFGNDLGIPYVLTLQGREAFEIDREGYRGKRIASTVAIVEMREQTAFGPRLVRNYYFGTEDGAIYRIAAHQ